MSRLEELIESFILESSELEKNVWMDRLYVLIAEAQRDALEKAVRIAKDYGDEVDTFEEERTAKYIADRIRALIPSEVNND